MADIEALRTLIADYSLRFRKEGLPPITEGELYNLRVDATNEAPSSLGWPNEWPFAARRGVYAILSLGRVLYVGKASQQSLGSRLGGYFCYGPGKFGCVTRSGHVWTQTPTHVAVWAVPENMPFEASALEEFLIGELNEQLPDNTVGKTA